MEKKIPALYNKNLAPLAPMLTALEGKGAVFP